MKYLKNIGISFLIMLGIIIISSLILTTLNYFDIFNKSTISIFKILIIVITYFIGGLLIGKKSIKKGWLEGLKFGLIVSIILILFNILGLSQEFNLKLIFYYLILISSTILGSMIGINKKN